jgi:hypothetical protein
MQLFRGDKLYKQKYIKVKEVIATAAKYFKSEVNQQSSKSSLKAELSKWKEEAQSQYGIIKNLEYSIIE